MEVGDGEIAVPHAVHRPAAPTSRVRSSLDFGAILLLF